MYKYLALIFLILISCRSKKEITKIETREDLVLHGMESMSSEKCNCKDPLHYVPVDSTIQDVRTIRLNFHFMNSTDSVYNFNGRDGRSYMWHLVENCNNRLKNNVSMNLPVGNNTPIYQPMIQYKRVGVNGDLGLYYHYDDDLAFFVNKGKNRNNYKKDMIEKYAISDDSILNVFVVPHHPDSLKTGRYKGGGTGIALGNSIKIAGPPEERVKHWAFTGLLNHEIGHVYGLRHAWNKYDKCDDTPPHKNCWNTSSSETCSNNVMDYNAQQEAYSPCQIGIIHKTIADTTSKRRGLVVPDWCDLDSTMTIVIDDNVEWKGHKDINRNIVIKDGASLTIYCRLSMAKGSNITVQDGGKLRLVNAHLHNDCNENWNGITKYNNANIEYIGKVRIENTNPNF